MSVQATSWVIEHSRHKGSNLLVLIMIANHAHSDGTNAFPSTETLARECRMSRRHVIRIIDELERSGELMVERSAGRKTHRYAIRMAVANRDNLSQLASEKPPPNRDTVMSPLEETNRDNLSQLTVTNPAPNCDKSDTSTVTSVSSPKDNNLNNTDEPSERGRRRRHSPAGDPRSSHPAIAALREITNRFPNKALYDELIAEIGEAPDIAKLRACYVAWVKRGFNEMNYAWAVEWYRHGIPKFTPSNGNGLPHVDRDADCAECKNERRVNYSFDERYPCPRCRPAESRAWLRSRGRL